MVAVSVLAVLIVIPAFPRLLLAVPVSSRVIIPASSFNDDFGTAGFVGFIVAAIAVIVNSDTRSSLVFLSASMTNGCRLFQDAQLFSEICVCVWNLDLRRSSEMGVSLKNLALVHVDSFGDAVRQTVSFVAQWGTCLPSLVWTNALATFAGMGFKMEQEPGLFRG